MPELLTRKGARNLTETLDRVASTVQEKHALLGLPGDVALDFAKRCDLISDAVELTASSNYPIKQGGDGDADTVPAQDADPEVTGVDDESGGDTDESPASTDQNTPEHYMDGKQAADDEALLRKLLAEEKMAAPEWAQPAKNETGQSVEPGGSAAPHWDANAIGDDRGGPYKMEPDEPYMAGEFTQERFHQLHDKQVAGELPGVDAKLASLDGSEESLRALAASIQKVVTAAGEVDISKMPGFSPSQLRGQIDQVVALRHEIEKITSQYESVLKQLKDLEKEEKDGLATLKKAAGQMREKGKYLAETEKALLQFTAYLTDKRPGIEQMIARGDEYKGQKAGDFFGRIAAKLGDDVAEAVEAIYEATKEDLTHTTMAVRGLKIVEKTASYDGATLKQAGIADVVVSLKEWMAGKADAVAKRILGFSGDIAKWFKGFMERTKIVKKNSQGLIGLIGQAEKDMDSALASMGKFASDDTGFNLTE